MKINPQTKMSPLLKANPEALDEIVKLSPKFAKLRNPLLRKVMAPRVNIQEAAKMGGCKPEDFFAALQPLGFVIDDINNIGKNFINDKPEKTQNQTEISCETKPEWLVNANKDDIKILDVRPVISSGKDPLEMIMKSLKENNQNPVFCLVNSFEPIPLINLLKSKGYGSFAEHISAEEVHTYFIKTEAENKLSEKQPKPDETDYFIKNLTDFNALAERFDEKLCNVDVRQLEMPLPMLTILENLEQLPEHHALHVHHKKVPLYLLPELEERGFEYHICEVEENNVKLLIHHK